MAARSLVFAGSQCYHPPPKMVDLASGTDLMDNQKDSRDQREEIRVVDRRFFTPEGEARNPDAASIDSETPAVTRSVTAAVPPGPIEFPVAPGRGSAAAPGRDPGPPGAGGTPGTASTVSDPVAAAHFKNLILNLATSAAANLGEIPQPYSQLTEVDLEGARQLIDLLHALKIKTQGNLNQEEASLLDSLLYDLQVKFVSLQSKPPKRP